MWGGHIATISVEVSYECVKRCDAVKYILGGRGWGVTGNWNNDIVKML